MFNSGHGNVHKVKIELNGYFSLISITQPSPYAASIKPLISLRD